MFWLHLNWGQLFSSPRKIFLSVLNVIIVMIGAAIVSRHESPFSVIKPLTRAQMGLGLWVSGVAIHADTNHKPFSCANTAAERS